MTTDGALDSVRNEYGVPDKGNIDNSLPEQQESNFLELSTKTVENEQIIDEEADAEAS